MDAPPYVVTVSWSVGDALVVEHPNLQPWEAWAVLEEAIEKVAQEIELEEVE